MWRLGSSRPHWDGACGMSCQDDVIGLHLPSLQTKFVLPDLSLGSRIRSQHDEIGGATVQVSTLAFAGMRPAANHAARGPSLSEKRREYIYDPVPYLKHQHLFLTPPLPGIFSVAGHQSFQSAFIYRSACLPKASPRWRSSPELPRRSTVRT